MGDFYLTTHEATSSHTRIACGFNIRTKPEYNKKELFFYQTVLSKITLIFYQIITRLLGAIYILSVRFTLNVSYHSLKFLGVILARKIAGP